MQGRRFRLFCLKGRVSKNLWTKHRVGSPDNQPHPWATWGIPSHLINMTKDTFSPPPLSTCQGLEVRLEVGTKTKCTYFLLQTTILPLSISLLATVYFFAPEYFLFQKWLLAGKKIRSICYVFTGRQRDVLAKTQVLDSNLTPYPSIFSLNRAFVSLTRWWTDLGAGIIYLSLIQTCVKFWRCEMHD